jgi:hypothetical protein
MGSWLTSSSTPTSSSTISEALGASEMVVTGCIISVITRAELFAGNTDSELVSTLIAPFREFAVEITVTGRAGRVSPRDRRPATRRADGG